MTREEQRAYDRTAFMARTKGVSAYKVAQALSACNGVVDFRRMSRGDMADAWADAKNGFDQYGRYGRYLGNVTLIKLRERIDTLLKTGRL